VCCEKRHSIQKTQKKYTVDLHASEMYIIKHHARYENARKSSSAVQCKARSVIKSRNAGYVRIAWHGILVVWTGKPSIAWTELTAIWVGWQSYKKCETMHRYKQLTSTFNSQSRFIELTNRRNLAFTQQRWNYCLRMPHYNTVKRTTVLQTRLDNRRRRQQTYSTFHISYLQHKQPARPTLDDTSIYII